VSIALGLWLAVSTVPFALLPGGANDDLCDATPQKVDAIVDTQVSAIARDYRSRPARPDLGFYTSSALCASRCRKARPELAQCLARVNRYLDANCGAYGQSDRVLGMDVPDSEYIAEAKKMFGGEMMAVPKDILDASRKFLGLVDFAKAIDKLGYRYVSYGSSLLDGRFAILIEGTKFDRVVQFATSAGIVSMNVDFIAMQKQTESGASLAKPRAWFNGYRWVNGDIGQKSPMTTRCLSCHANGWRQIHTQYLGKLTPSSEASYEYFRKKFSSSGPSDFAHFDPTANGPPLGAIDPPGRLERIAKGCASGLAPDRRELVASAMSCARCHDGRQLGILSGVTSYYWSLRHKVTVLGTNNPAASMPPASPLNGFERSIIVTCLREEYGEQLRAWLTENKCAQR